MKRVAHKVTHSKKKKVHFSLKKFLLPFLALATAVVSVALVVWFSFGPIKQSSAGFCANNSKCAFNEVCAPWHFCVKLACSPGLRCSGHLTGIPAPHAHSCGEDNYTYTCRKSAYGTYLCGANCTSSKDCGSNQTCLNCRCAPKPGPRTAN